MKRDWIPASRRIVLLILLILLVLLFLVVPGVSWANTLDDSARQLAQEIAAALAPRATVMLHVRNLSLLGAADVAGVRRALEVELQSRGFRLAANGKSDAEVRVTLSENLDGYLWVAEVVRGDSLGLAMVALPRPAAASQPPPGPTLAIRKELLWEQEAQILDLRLLDATVAKEQKMVVLEPTGVSLYEKKDERWELRRAFPIEVAKPRPRDLRGMVLYNGATQGEDVVGIALPGMGCHLQLSGVPQSLGIRCEQGNKFGWFIFAGAQLAGAGAEFTDSKNFFTGRFYDIETTSIRRVVPPFFSAAVLPGGSAASERWIYAGLRGDTQIQKDGSELTSLGVRWGSNLASVKANCGSNWQVLATRAGDWTEADAIQAYEIREREALAVSPPVELPGPVMSLEAWSEDVALATVRNLKTGRYEAYRLLISCGR